MKLLFDQNLSFRLISTLKDLFPESVHVNDIGLDNADDQKIWEYAKIQNLVIVSKDSDFHQMSFVFGAPPKVVWLRCGNVSTKQIETILRNHADEIRQFEKNEQAAFLVLS